MDEALPRGDFNYPSRYRIGAGRRAELAGVCRELGIARPLVVTDPGLRALDWFAPIEASLSDAGLAVAVFSEVAPNPASDDVDAGVAAARAHDADGCLAIGGGSALDVGKCIALLARNPGGILDYEDVGDNWRRADAARMLPTIALPTTAGTGSEVGRAAVILDPRDHGKKIVFHPDMQPDAVIADPELTLGLPPGLTASTGMDALAHCFEAWCAPGYHPMADGIALEGMRLIDRFLPRAFADGGDLEARTHMLMAASMGATAFQKGLGLVHALSHPVGGVAGIHHGTLNAIFQPYVMIHNRAAIEGRMPRVASALGLPGAGGSDGAAFEAVLEWTLALRRRLALPEDLAGRIDEARVPEIVRLAARDPSLATNPKPCSETEIEDVLRRTIVGELSA